MSISYPYPTVICQQDDQDSNYATAQLYLLPLSNIRNGGDAGNQPELGMVKHHELGVRAEAVVTLVGEAAAVAGGGLGPGRDVDGAGGAVSGVEDAVVVGLPGVGRELGGVRAGAVVEGDGGAGLQLRAGEQALAGAGDEGRGHRHQPRLVRVPGQRVCRVHRHRHRLLYTERDMPPTFADKVVAPDLPDVGVAAGVRGLQLGHEDPRLVLPHPRHPALAARHQHAALEGASQRRAEHKV